MKAEKDLRYPSTSLRASYFRRNRPVRPWGIAGHLVPFTEILETIGAPWRRSLSRAGLKTEYADPTECIDAERGLRFCQHMAHTQGIPDLGFRAAQRPAVPVLHPRLMRRLSEADTLVHAFCAFRELGHLQSSGLRVWLRATPDELQICHAGSIPIGWPAADQLEVFRTVRLIEVIRGHLGPAWVPTRIWLAQDRPAPPALESWLDGPEIHTGRECGMIAVSRAALRAAELNPKAGAAASADGSNTGLVRGILQTNLSFGTPTLEQVAAQIGISPSTLKRGLARSRTSYSELLDQVRYRMARRLLTETDLPLRDIAVEVGYTDPGNFSRAFRRITGLSPGELRRTPVA